MRVGSPKISTTSTLRRYEQVFGILIKYGFEDILSHPPLNKITPQTNLLVPSRNGKKVSQFTRYERIRMVCEELGTTFIKFAQIASNRPDLLPENLILQLEKLQDQAPKVPIDDIHKVLEGELSRPLHEVVEHFEEKPLASASMAQVHRARLIGGKEVVLKIQRPGIRATIDADIGILRNIISIIESYFPEYLVYQPHELLKMFVESIHEELSFRKEANNLKHFQKMFKDNDQVFIPAFYAELSTDRVLCMEYVAGHKITDLDHLSQFNITGEDLAFRGISLYFEQVFEHGFFHADPHPGNIFVLEDGRIAFIDYGMVGTVIDDDKIAFARILLAMYEEDVQGLKKAILKFSTGLTKDKIRELEYDIIYFLREYSSKAIEDIDGQEMMQGLNAMFFHYKLKIPSNLLLLLKALVIIEGVGLQLNPRYDIVQNIGPFAQRLLKKKYDPAKMQRELIRSLDDTTSLVKDFPQDIREILKKIKEGKIHMEFEHKGLSPFANTLSASINLLAYALLVVAITLGSALIIVAEVPPIYFNLSLFGIIGIGLATLLTLKILNDIRKSRKTRYDEPE